MPMQSRTSQDPWWLRVLNSVLTFVITAQLTFLLFVGAVVLGIVVGIIGRAMNR
jgi:hypothetical protein